MRQPVRQPPVDIPYSFIWNLILLWMDAFRRFENWFSLEKTFYLLMRWAEKVRKVYPRYSLGEISYKIERMAYTVSQTVWAILTDILTITILQIDPKSCTQYEPMR
jgi:hypothetical protein